MEAIRDVSINAKYYNAKIKNDGEFYANEKKRIADYMKNRYSNDAEYRERVKEQKRQAYHRKKNQNINNIPIGVV